LAQVCLPSSRRQQLRAPTPIKTMARLQLAPSCVLEEMDEEQSICGDAMPQSAGATPTAKRQRRLTLTAMTGLICELSQNQSGQTVAQEAPYQRHVGVGAQSTAEVQALVDNPNAVTQRDPSPVRRLKRDRASIGATATADMMIAQAARTLTTSGNKLQTSASDSSDSTEEEEESLALRVRRAKAFDSGSQVSESAPQPPLSFPQEELSPRSKIAFSRGVRAAEVAAKVSAMMSGAIAAKDATSPQTAALKPDAQQKGAKVPPVSLRPQGGA